MGLFTRATIRAAMRFARRRPLPPHSLFREHYATRNAIVITFFLAMVVISRYLYIKNNKTPHHRSTFGFCKQVQIQGQDDYNVVHIVNLSATPVSEPGYTEDFWGTVYFSPVPPYHINTHNPETQDIFISGSVHSAKAPWDPYVWDLFLSVFMRHPSPGVVVDVGANIGYFSLLAATMGHKVYSFEPMNRNVAKLQSSILKNHLEHKITLIQNAVTYDSTGSVTLRATHESNQGNGMIIPIPESVSESGIYGQDYAHTIRLDEVVREDVLLMKIDVEGYEGSVLNGAKSLICNHIVRYIAIEFSSNTQYSQICSANAMLATLELIGYTMSDIVLDSPVLQVSPQLPPNLLFTLKDPSRTPASRHGSVPDSPCKI